MSLNQSPITKLVREPKAKEDSFRIENMVDQSAAEEEGRLIYALSKPSRDY